MAMDSSIAQSHHQEIGSQTLESMLASTKPQQEKKPRPSEQALKCPRCDSTNTKFCYYNNYSLSQPRYFCKSCRRYWTKGGTLRNVPVGGGCRKNKRSSSSSSKRNHDQPITRSIPSPIPSYRPLSYDSNHMFPKQTGGQLGLDDPAGFAMSVNPNMSLSDYGLIDALRGEFLETQRGFQNLYYGIGDGVNLGLENGGMGMGMGIYGNNQEMGLMGFEEMSGGATTTSTAVTTVKQEMCGNVGGENSRGLWGFSWQNVGGDGNMGDLGWINGIGSSNLHGLLNSPLM